MKSLVLEDNKQDIINLYLYEKKSQEELSKIYNVSKGMISLFIKKWNLKKINRIYRSFTTEEKNNIIDLYVNKKRGKSYIASLYNCSDSTISYNLKKWKVKNIDRKTIQQNVYEIHGYKSNGFKGKSHSEISKSKISESLCKKYVETENICMNEPRSLMINTKVGRVLGSYEAAFIQKFFIENNKFPEKPTQRIKTPFGSYLPDFKFDDLYYDIKSDYTYLIYKSSNQSRKVDWILNNTNIKIEIVVLDKKEAWRLFKESIKNNIVLDQIKISGNQYEILSRA